MITHLKHTFARKSVKQTLLFYASYTVIGLIGLKVSPPDMCNLGFGLILLFSLPVISILAIIHLILYDFAGKKHHRLLLILHSIVHVAFFCFFVSL
jgi:hypothetical protein